MPPPPVDMGDGSGDGSTLNPEPAAKRDLTDLVDLEIYEQTGDLPDWSGLWKKSDDVAKRQNEEADDTDPAETIAAGQQTATQDDCNDNSTSTTSGTISSSTTGAVSSLTSSTTSTFMNTTSTFPQATKTATSTTSCPPELGPWATSASYEKWDSQEGCTPVTRTIGGKVGVYAVPTETIYIDYVEDVCETGRYSKTITVTATCNKGCDAKPTGVPQGYTTSAVYCSACATPSNVLVTIKSGEVWHAKSAAEVAAAAGSGAAEPADMDGGAAHGNSAGHQGADQGPSDPGSSPVNPVDDHADDQWSDSPAGAVAPIAPSKPAEDHVADDQWLDSGLGAAPTATGAKPATNDQVANDQWADSSPEAVPSSDKPADNQVADNQWADSPSEAVPASDKPANSQVANDHWADSPPGAGPASGKPADNQVANQWSDSPSEPASATNAVASSAGNGDWADAGSSADSTGGKGVADYTGGAIANAGVGNCGLAVIIAVAAGIVIF